MTKRKKVVLKFLNHMNDHLPKLCDKINGWWGRPHLREILGQTDSIGVKSPIFDLFSPVAPQP